MAMDWRHLLADAAAFCQPKSQLIIYISSKVSADPLRFSFLYSSMLGSHKLSFVLSRSFSGVLDHYIHIQLCTWANIANVMRNCLLFRRSSFACGLALGCFIVSEEDYWLLAILFGFVNVFSDKWCVLGSPLLQCTCKSLLPCWSGQNCYHPCVVTMLFLLANRFHQNYRGIPRSSTAGSHSVGIGAQCVWSFCLDLCKWSVFEEMHYSICHMSHRPRKCPCTRFFKISEQVIFIQSLKKNFLFFSNSEIWKIGYGDMFPTDGLYRECAQWHSHKSTSGGCSKLCNWICFNGLLQRHNT